MEFKDTFKQLRKDKDIGQIRLAKDLDVSNAVISYWETGRNEPTLPMLKKIARYFNVSSDYLIGLENEDGTKNHDTAPVPPAPTPQKVWGEPKPKWYGNVAAAHGNPPDMSKADADPERAIAMLEEIAKKVAKTDK